MSPLDGAWVPVHASFSFEDAIFDSIKNELDDATADTGPIAFDVGPAAFNSHEDCEASRATSPAPPPATTPSHIASQTSLRRHSDLAYSVFGGDSPPSSAPSSRSPSRSPSPTKNSKKRSQNRKSKAKRSKKRQRERLEDPKAARNSDSHTKKTHIAGAQKTAVAYNFKDIPSASTAYVAKQERPKRSKPGAAHTLSELLAQGFKLIKWDGRSPKPIVDSNGLVVTVLVGRPNDPGWQHVHDEALNLLLENTDSCDFTEKCMSHRRGNFAALNVGISFGGGPKVPGNLAHNEARTNVLNKLTNSPCFTRLAGFASSALASWMPRLHRHYQTCLSALTAHPTGKNLTPNFPNSVWAAAAFNFGPRTVTAKHRDAANLPYGICSVTALGRYDYVEGGHVVLWEFGLVIEFPPGSTILIPSAAVTHSNTSIGNHEERCSFTQYSAGGLFRWVDQGFQRKDRYLASLSQEARNKLPELDEARCARATSFFSTLDELRAVAKPAAAPTDLQPRV